MIVLQIIFWLIAFLVFHTYLGFPLILQILSRNKKLSFRESEQQPKVSVIMSLFNEESVIEEKLNTLLNSNYSSEKIQILIGSDNSTDKTSEIVKNFEAKHSNIKFFDFIERQGKSNVINSIIDKSEGEILILTDANVFFEPQTISELVKPFSDQNIGLVDSKMVNTGLKKEGISIQEKSYISREVKIKHLEGLLWGTMMGPFGGCFAIRKSLYSPVPHNFLVDDFYICMKVLQTGSKAINNLNAIVLEDVSNNLKDEFRRKVRIATGNFQNLWKFKRMLFPPWTAAAFCFMSHKVLRWITPVLIIISYIINIFLALHFQFYLILLIIYTLIFILVPIDLLSKNLNINNKFLRFVTHFFSMNLALLIGMFRNMKGVKSNVWKPTKRNQ
jgi:cellulose synthase/poly-beta-1,6-N-acetylglucosamine synthase-like glycosyltransferase